ncbi:TIGR04222 domain-containing membrane protein [Amycolatopsis cihanbeyliensis]|uniref:Uncharacterized protein (TIGR04222 family) n=1 Tax=Amycolatopsis cihanbeyliensis TaxID=1128664 RepID=A0A542DDA1_AMYCI|nr:TIGR04222 domain-containing membrane protein [Amycolatopsis cihanbeyliensis]TQJ01041.1 uncharacterized protein (TIGR04222 family) [Amycolatopsis cihanbeyliensis]
MGEQWGMSGGAFLLLYLGLLNLPWITGVVMARARRRMAMRRASRYGDQLPTPRHLAYLTGGPIQVVETTIASLLHSEKLRVNSGGFFQAARGAAGDDQLEDAVLDSARRRRSATRGGLVGSTRRSPGVREIERHLARNGLISFELHDRRRTSTVLILQVLVLAFGLAALLTSGDPDGFTAFLVLLLLIGVSSLISGLIVHFARGPDGTPTLAGRRLTTRSVATAWPGAVGAVALGGLASYPDPQIAAAAAKIEPVGGTSPAGTPHHGGGGGGGGGGCGGGGCGGGGCGGGGGGCGG